MISYSGEHEYAIDAKGRTSFPAAFRELMSASGENTLFVTRGAGGCLWCFPPSLWEAYKARLQAIEGSAGHKARQLYIGSAHPCEVDRMGRILIPVTLRSKAGLEHEVVWRGIGDRIELWSRANWRQKEAELEAEVASIEDLVV